MQTIQILIAILLLCPLPVFAQTNKGGMSGTVFDGTGAVVPDATVVITNIGTNEQLRLTTSGSGTFSAPLLDPVEYRITVEAPGFKKVLLYWKK